MNWMKKVAVALVCLLPLGLQAAKVDTLQVKSPSMNKSIEVVVVSPDMAATEACPVIYLLHGYGGNARTWVGIKPDLPKIADEKGIFFVCPDGKNTWYWDSPLNADVRYETFISDELVKYVDSHYKTVADRKVHYRYAKSLKGPWIKPANDIFDGIAFYAGKTMSNGKERYLAGWCPTRIGDGDPDQWGGSLVCHHMLFNADGTIDLKLPDGIDKKFTTLKKTVLIDKSGKAVKKENSYVLSDVASVSFPRLDKTCKIEATVKATGDEDVFGFAFGACDDKTEVYSIRFDLKSKKMIMSKDDLTRGTTPAQTDVTLAVPADKQFKVKIVAEKSVCVMYVNDKIAFSNRIDKMPKNPWAIFTDKGTEISFSDIKVYE